MKKLKTILLSILLSPITILVLIFIIPFTKQGRDMYNNFKEIIKNNYNR